MCTNFKIWYFRPTQIFVKHFCQGFQIFPYDIVRPNIRKYNVQKHYDT